MLLFYFALPATVQALNEGVGMKLNTVLRIAFQFFSIIALSACTGSGFDTQSQSSAGKSKITFSNDSSSSSSSGGNGEFYGGKPGNGTYVREVPGVSCGNLGSRIGEIVVTDDSATGTFVNPENCQITQQALSRDRLEFISYHAGLLSLAEGIYNKDNKPSEVWCREEGSTTDEGFDVKVVADYQKMRFQAVVVTGVKRADGSIERKEYVNQITRRDVDAGERVRYRAGEDAFELEIRTRTFRASTGTMTGEFLYAMNGISASRNLNCRMGGEFDIMAPARPYDIALQSAKKVFNGLIAWLGLGGIPKA